MPQNTVEFRCLLVSPSDVVQDRESLIAVVAGWNAHIGRGLGARVEIVRWETHTIPEMGSPPQTILNRQLLPDCDLAIALFWSRVGTPTDNHPSGSAEEIAELRQREVPVMVYFCTRDYPQQSLDLSQIGGLRNLRCAYEREGLLALYSDSADLGAKVNLHLTTLISQLLTRNAPASSIGMPTDGILTASTPDVRVSVANGWTQVGSAPQVALLITVQNYSPVPVYISSVFIEAPDYGIMHLHRDYIDGHVLRTRELAPGRSFLVSVDPRELREMMQQTRLTCAAARDEIGRAYRSSEEEFTRAVRITLEQYDGLHTGDNA